MPGPVPAGTLGLVVVGVVDGDLLLVMVTMPLGVVVGAALVVERRVEVDLVVGAGAWPGMHCE